MQKNKTTISKNYGHDLLVKKYYNLPVWLPIKAIIQHGWYNNKTAKHDTKKNLKLYLCWSSRIKNEIIKSYSNANVYVVGSPFINYRRLMNIKKEDSAQGTIVFVPHSSKSASVNLDIGKYAKSIRSLPLKFHPIDICLHYMDYEQDGDKWRNMGFKVYTAGKSKDGFNFFNEFYKILVKYKYSTSADVGSFMFYSIDLGVPFFLSSQTALKGWVDVQTGLKLDLKKNDEDKLIDVLFEGFYDSVHPLQQELLKRECGLIDADDYNHVRKALLNSTFTGRIYGVLEDCMNFFKFKELAR